LHMAIDSADIVKFVVIVLVIVIIVRWILRLLGKGKRIPKRRPLPRFRGKIVRAYLPPRMKARAERKYKKRLRIWRTQHKRNPSKSEKFTIVVSASHTVVRSHSKWGHWERQKIRKYLLEKHKIVKKYTMS